MVPIIACHVTDGAVFSPTSPLGPVFRVYVWVGAGVGPRAAYNVYRM